MGKNEITVRVGDKEQTIDLGLDLEFANELLREGKHSERYELFESVIRSARSEVDRVLADLLYSGE